MRFRSSRHRALPLVVLVGAVVAASCVPLSPQTQGPKIISPQLPELAGVVSGPMAGSLADPVVDSLQPVLRWENSLGPQATWDLCIWDRTGVWEKSKTKSWLTGGTITPWGTLLYCRAGLATTSYKVEYKLKPNTSYAWSVRLHTKKTIGPWASYSRDALGWVNTVSRNVPYTFRTPKLP